MDTKMYTVSEALALLQEAQENNLETLTIQGIHPNCADQIRNLCSLPQESLHCFINQVTRLPGATYTLSA